MSYGTKSDEIGANSDYPLARSPATVMLAAGIGRLQAATGMTQRDIASKLNYKTSVVLSHMALGRVPIPIDRALDIAQLLQIDPPTFLLATLKQRHPDVDFGALFGVQLPPTSAVAAELEAIAGVPLDDLPTGTVQILQEVVASADPGRRWATPAELATLETIRNEMTRR